MGKLKSARAWQKLINSLNFKERLWLCFFLALFLGSLIWLSSNWYIARTHVSPKAGGTYTEALIDSPHFLNPLLVTNDADRDLSSLIFSGLLKYDANGKLTGDLAKNFETSKDGRTYTIELKPNVSWHDGKPLSAKDVIFTISAVQNPDYKSPLRANWQGVNAEAQGDSKIVIKLKTPYAAFASNLTLGILPSHIWQAVSPQNFPLAEFNQKPIGSGPYKFVRLTKNKLGRISSVELETNEKYFDGAPFIQNLIFKSYNNEEEALAAFNRKEVDGLGSLNNKSKSQLRGTGTTKIYSLAMPRIYAVFFNTNDATLNNGKVRRALNYGLDKVALATQIVGQNGKLAKGPIPPGILNEVTLSDYSFSIDKANQLLDDDGWKKDDSGLRAKKINKKNKRVTPLKITLTTANTLQLIETASIIKDNWSKLDVQVDLNILDIGELQQNYIKPRNYQALLIGEVLGLEPDPFAFWHSKEIKDPGLNLSLYTNKTVDQILERARQIVNPQTRQQEYLKFEKLVIDDAPAVFLYSPDYLYAIPDSIHNADQKVIAVPSNRFNNINHWYIYTQRIWNK